MLSYKRSSLDPQKYVKHWPSGLLLWVKGHYFTYFGGFRKPKTAKEIELRRMAE